MKCLTVTPEQAISVSEDKLIAPFKRTNTCQTSIEIKIGKISKSLDKDWQQQRISGSVFVIVHSFTVTHCYWLRTFLCGVVCCVIARIKLWEPLSWVFSQRAPSLWTQSSVERSGKVDAFWWNRDRENTNKNTNKHGVLCLWVGWMPGYC